MISADHISEVVSLHLAKVAPRGSACERNGLLSREVLRAIRRPKLWTAIERRHHVAQYLLPSTDLQGSRL
jgi:hypothetical protein